MTAVRKKLPLIPTDATLTIGAGKTLSTSVNLDVSGADVDIVGSGSAVVTFPATTSTLATTAQLPVKATGTELDALTDDAKFLTAKAVQDGKNVPHVAPGTAGNIMQSDGTNWGGGAITQAILPTTTLGIAQKTTNFTGTGFNMQQVTGLSVTVTVPAGGRRVKITGFSDYVSAGGTVYFAIWDGVVGSGTKIAQGSGPTGVGAIVIAVVTPSAGSKTYNVGIASGSGTVGLLADATYPSFILVELI